MISNNTQHHTNDRHIAVWLFVVAALIFSMVVLGGVTRLTRSGLSMVEWDPIMGAIPPLSQQQWQSTFDKYRQFPEYQKINRGMSLDEFKSIFWFEYSHRLLGRAIGLAFLLPFLYFWLRKKIRRELVPRLVVMFILGGLQGLLGWYMVKSGLIDNPHVSQYRLTAHLSAAIIIYSFILWVAWGLLKPANVLYGHSTPGKLRSNGLLISVLIFIMILSGGFVAGTRAGFAFNTFPTMNGFWIPPGIMDMQPWYMNFFENITTIQFTHRLIAVLVTLGVVGYWLRSRNYPLAGSTRTGFNVLLFILVVQVSLGISTLLMAVPVPLAAAHQAGALLLFTAALYLNSELRMR